MVGVCTLKEIEKNYAAVYFFRELFCRERLCQPGQPCQRKYRREGEVPM